jgi:hypothetical protein
MPKATLDRRTMARLYIDTVKSDIEKCAKDVNCEDLLTFEKNVDAYVRTSYGGPRAKNNPRQVQNLTYARDMKQAWRPKDFPFSNLAETIKKYSRKGKETLPKGTKIRFEFEGPNNEVLTEEKLYNFQLENFENCAVYIGNKYSYHLLEGCLHDKTLPIKDRNYLYFGVFAKPGGLIPEGTQLGFLICHKETQEFGTTMDIALVCSDYGIGMALFEEVLNYLHVHKELLGIKYATLHALNYDVAKRYGTFSGFQFAGFWDLTDDDDGNFQYVPLDLPTADRIAKDSFKRHGNDYLQFWRGSILIQDPTEREAPRVLDLKRPGDVKRWEQTDEDIRKYYGAFYGVNLKGPGAREYVPLDTQEGQFKEIMVPMVVKL